MDYLKEIIQILENNDIKTLPSKELISSNEQVALAVWKNFTLDGDYYGYYSFNEWYEAANWGQTLSAYKDNIGFWEKAIKVQIGNEEMDIQYSDFYTYPQFKEDFPLIADHISKDNNLLVELLFRTNKRDFLDQLTLPEDEKTKIEKQFYLKNYHSLAPVAAQHYENDPEFITQLLKVAPHFYGGLSEEAKNNDEYIKLAMKHSNNFGYIPVEKADQYFSGWLKDNLHQKFILTQFTENQQYQILAKKPEMLAPLLDKDPYKYKDFAINAIAKSNGDVNHIVDICNAFTLPQLINVFKQPSDLEKVRPMLEFFVKNYNSTKEISKKENKVMAIIELDTDLTNKLRENIFYQLNEMKPGYKLSKEKFDNYADQVIAKVNNNELDTDKASSFLGRLKNKLSIELLQAEKYPHKDLYEYIAAQRKTVSSKKLKM